MKSRLAQYRQLLRLSRAVDNDQGCRAFLLLSQLTSATTGLDSLPTSLPLETFVKQTARTLHSNPIDKQAVAAGIAELRFALARHTLYAQRKAALQLHEPTLTPNQLWYEGRVLQLGPAHALQLLQEAFDAGVIPTLLMYSAAISAASQGGSWSTVLHLLRHLETTSPWLPDSGIAGKVVVALLHAQGLQGAIHGAQSFHRADYSRFVDVLRLQCHKAELSASTAAIIPAQVLRQQASALQLPMQPHERVLLSTLGEALVPDLHHPITNAEALERYIRLCRQCGAVREANRVQSYIFAHEQYALEEAEGDLVVGLPTD